MFSFKNKYITNVSYILLKERKIIMAEFREIPLPVENPLDIVVPDEAPKKVSSRKKKKEATEGGVE
jgi:hypothetical protein